MINNFFRFSVIILSLTAFFACGDKDEDNKEPLKPAYVEVNSADLALLFTGEAGEKTIAVLANREVEASSSVNWATTAVTVNEDKSISLKIVVTKSDAAKKRTGIVTLTTKLADASDKAAAPLEVKMEQAVFGLPEADLLDVVFTATGPIDISPLQNKIWDVLPSLGSSGTDVSRPKEYPDIKENNKYHKLTARFSGPNHTDAGGQEQERGSCAYRVNLADYSKVVGTSWQTAAIPYTPLGTALKEGAFSAEIIFSQHPHTTTGRAYPFSWQQSCGGGFGFDPVPGGGSQTARQFQWSVSVSPDGTYSNGTSATVTDTETLGLLEHDPDVFYHAIGTFDPQAGVLKLYVDGELQGESKFDAGSKQIFPFYDGSKWIAYTAADAISQWICIGGDARRADDPANPTNHMNSDWTNWAEYMFTGEIVVARLYGKALSADEVKTLYNYEKPE